MECNKDEAVKVKELAEKKFQEKDIVGARKLALKAQRLFPSLDGIPNLLATLNIYVSAERKINGEVDWYGVLGIDPSSDEETVKKQYRKLALTLHPDKNKSVGAEGAFKILSEAWSLLSDRSKRAAYDQKRNSRGIYQKVMTSNPSKPVDRNGLRPSVNVGNFNDRTRNYPNPHSIPTAPPQRKTFWTRCTSCEMQFEYVLLYLNKKLECYNCKEPFVATQIPPPQMNCPPPWSSYMPQQTSGNTAAAYSSSTGGRLFTGSVGHPGGLGNVQASASSVPQTMNGIKSPCENTKRIYEDAHVSATVEDALKSRTNAFKRANAGETNVASATLKVEKPRKRRRTNEAKMNGTGVENIDQLARGSQTAAYGNSSGVERFIGETEKVSIGSKWTASTRELSLLEIRNMLMTKAKTEICKKLNEWKSITSTTTALGKDSGVKETEKTKQRRSIKNVSNADANGVDNSGNKAGVYARDKYPDEKLKTSLIDSYSVDSEAQASDSAPLSMTVPDPDFHDFDKDRTVGAFGDNQVWAAYDDDDGMPRYYAMIHNVISRKPFKMRISWLNSKSNAEFGPLNWVGSGFFKTSGNFRVGQYKIYESANAFSHRVKWTKGLRGAIQIYPSKGDVWALYRNWSPEWNEHTPDEVIHQYDMVEVLDDYDKEKGVTVIPLVKVAGFRTVFRQHMDKEQAMVIPREEMFRLSHQVPFCLLTGEESPRAPKGCLELDPAATPMELLQVIPESKEELKKNDTENPHKSQHSTPVKLKM